MSEAKEVKCYIKPRPGSVVIIQDQGLEIIGRIHVPDKYKRRPTTGIVVRVGENCQQEFSRIGARVLFPQYSGIGYKFKDGSAWRVLSEDEISGEIEGNAELELDETAPTEG